MRAVLFGCAIYSLILFVLGDWVKPFGLGCMVSIFAGLGFLCPRNVIDISFLDKDN